MRGGTDYYLHGEPQLFEARERVVQQLSNGLLQQCFRALLRHVSRFVACSPPILKHSYSPIRHFSSVSWNVSLTNLRIFDGEVGAEKWLVAGLGGPFLDFFRGGSMLSARLQQLHLEHHGSPKQERLEHISLQLAQHKTGHQQAVLLQLLVPIGNQTLTRMRKLANFCI